MTDPTREAVQEALDWYQLSGMLPHSVHVAFEAARLWLEGPTEAMIERAGIRAAEINLGDTLVDALKRHEMGIWRSGDCDRFATAARLWLEGPKVDEAMIERATYELTKNELGCPDGQYGYRPLMPTEAKPIMWRVLRAALGVPDE